MPDLAATSELFKLLADPSRVRLLRLLDADELTVAELVEATRLVQSRVSTHLARLRDGGLASVRRQGASTYWSLRDGALDASAASAWSLVREHTADPVLADDRARLERVLARRAGTWAESVAGRMERHYSPGRTWESAASALVGLAQLGDVVDIASGDGAIAELVAPRARSVTCVDIHERVISAGQRRARGKGIQFRLGDMHALPFAPACFDHALLLHALSHAREPDEVIAEVARVLRDGGAVVAQTLRAHDHARVARRFDHIHFGFELEDFAERFERGGFDVIDNRVTSRERRTPHFEIITLTARRRARTEEDTP